MKTRILKESKIEEYYKSVIRTTNGISSSNIKADILGIEEIELEEAKKKANIGDCLLLEYDGKLLPFQIIDKKNDKVTLASYYVLDNHIFDEKTNVWRDSSIRKYMNEEMIKKFNPEIQEMIKEKEVHTDDYVTNDKLWLLSHEEIGYKDENEMFRKNIGAKTFDYYRKEI